MTKYTEYSIKAFKHEPQNLRLKVNASTAIYNVHKAVVQQLHQQRQGNANSKTRSEVQGGGRKPWKQKGTGRARAGSIRSPLWRGGGVIFGPKTKEYKQKINKKEKSLALSNILYNKKDFIISLPSSFLQLENPKTQFFLNRIKELKIQKDKKLLIIMNRKYTNTYLATRNLQHINCIAADHLNILALIKTDYILIEDQAIETINNNLS